MFFWVKCATTTLLFSQNTGSAVER